MAAKDIAVKKYVVKLDEAERNRLQVVDQQEKKPGEAAAESPDIAQGRCWRARRGLERRPDRRSPGYKHIHGDTGPTAIRGRRS